MAAIAPAQSASRTRRRQMSDGTLIRLFIFPTLIVLILWNVFPLAYSLYLSFTNYSAIANKVPKWVGLDNYARVLESEKFWGYFATTGKYALLSVSIQVILGFGLALLLRQKFKGSGIITTLLLIPMMLSPVVVGLFWKLIYNPSYGIFNYLLNPASPRLATEMLRSPDTAMIAVVIADVWMWTPFVMLLCLSGLSAIPDYLYVFVGCSFQVRGR